MTVFWWLLVGWCVCIVALAFTMYFSNRNRPRCPVHDEYMDMYGEDGDVDEYGCQVKGCRWCATVDRDGRVQKFEV